MMRLIKTTKVGTNGHYHWIFFDDADISGGSISVSESKGHTHEAFILLPQEIEEDIEQLDPSLINLFPVREGKSKKEHTHQPTSEEIIQTDEVELKIIAESEEEIVLQNESLFISMKDREQSSKVEGNICEKFNKENNQWIDDDGKALILKSGLTRVTINLIQALTNILYGMHRDSRTEIKYVPVEGSDALIADVYTFILKSELSHNNAAFQENQAFEDTVNTGRGNYYVSINREKDLRGNISIKRLPWRAVYYAEHDEMDAVDAPAIMYASYHTKPDVMTMVDEDREEEVAKTADLIRNEFERGDKKDDQTSEYNETNSLSDAYNVNSKKYRVLNVWRYEHKRIYSMINENFFFTSATKIQDKAQLESLGFKFVQRKRSYVRFQKILSERIVLEDEISEIDALQIVPHYYEKSGDKFSGKVILALPLQRFYNKLASKIMDFVHKSINDLILYDKDTFKRHGTPSQNKTIQKDLTSAGGAVEINDVKRPPIQFKTSPLPSYLFNLLVAIKEIMQTILNLNAASLGEQSSESGIKVLQNKQQSKMGNEKLYDNLAQTKIQIGKIALKAIKICYADNPERVRRLLKENDFTEVDQSFRFSPNKIKTGESFNDEEIDEVMLRLKDADSDKLDVVPVQVPNTPTMLIGNFMLLTEAVQSGQFPIPPEVLLEMNPFIDYKTKQKVLKMVEDAKKEQVAIQERDREAQDSRTELAAKGRITQELIKQVGKNNSEQQKRSFE